MIAVTGLCLRRWSMFALILLPAAARAQGGGSDQGAKAVVAPELVYSASRYAQDVNDAPASVTIITAREIREFGYRTLADALGSVRGFSTRSDLNYDYVTVRGLARYDFNTRILVLVDGQRINGAVNDESSLGTEALIDLSRVHHIEVIRGPGSAQYGTNAFFAVVNVVTGRGLGVTGGVTSGLYAGSSGTLGAGIGWSTPSIASTQLLLGANVARRGGSDRYYPEFDTPSTNHGVAHGVDGEESVKLFGSGRRGDWSFEGAWALRRRDIPTASYQTVFNGPERVFDRAALASVTYSHGFQDLSRVNVAAGLTRSSYNGSYPYDASSLADYAISNTWSLEAQYLRVVGPGHKFTVGSELRWVGDGSQGAVNVAPGVADIPVFRDIQSQVVGAAFAQVEWHLGEWALLTTGIRRDQYQHLGGTTNPRLALVLRPFEGTNIKALYGRAFREPDLYERFYRDGVTQKVPASLMPEHIHTAELEVEQRIGGVAMTVAAYNIIASDLINLTTDPADSMLVFANEGSPTARGLEFEVRGKLGPVTGRASYTWQHAREADGSRPVDGADHLARVGVSMPVVGDRGSVAVELRYVGARPTLRGADAPSYALTNLTLLARPFGRRLEVILSVKDLFNAGHVDPAGEEHTQNVLAQDGRTFRIGLRRSF